MTEKRLAPFGYTIFCDDIRHELGNKTSLIGVYENDMLFQHPTFPLLIPKLVMAIVVEVPKADLPDKIKLEIFFPGDEEIPMHTDTVNTTDAVSQRYETMQGETSGNAADRETFKFTFQLVLSPAKIDELGFIKVRAHLDGELLQLGQLRIGEAAPV